MIYLFVCLDFGVKYYLDMNLYCTYISNNVCFLVFSPFEVQVGPEAGPQKIRAWGPGLEGGVVGKSADFVAESIGTDVGVLGEITESSDQTRGTFYYTVVTFRSGSTTRFLSLLCKYF